MWCPSPPCNTGLLSSSFLILTLAKASTYIRPIRVRGAGGALPHQDFDRPVILISPGGGQVMPTTILLAPPPQDF